jgi:hypothetical protein
LESCPFWTMFMMMFFIQCYFWKRKETGFIFSFFFSIFFGLIKVLFFVEDPKHL